VVVAITATTLNPRDGRNIANHDDVDVDTLASAKRLGLGIALIWVLWLLGNSLIGYSSLVMTNARQARQAQAPPLKLSARELEAAFIDAKVFSPNSRLHCEPRTENWDYVCAFVPVPANGSNALQFGVKVDSKRWLQLSRKVPIGAPVPTSGQ
jgi:hypothetical protein